jgi:hypothetical protein
MQDTVLSTGQACLYLVAAMIRKVGLPKPAAVWLAYLVPELVLPFVMAISQFASRGFSLA